MSLTSRSSLCCAIFVLFALSCATTGARAETPSAAPNTAATSTPDDLAAGSYVIQFDKPAQVIWGLGYEIQSDSIGRANNGLPDAVVAVPHDLNPRERQRFYHDLLKGFRYCRLALGLYLRGTDEDKKHVVERYPGQMSDLAEMQKEAGIQGFDAEYWSPAPFWKTTHAFNGLDGFLKATDPTTLNDFGDACVQDVRYLESHGLRVVQWGLQNEPLVCHVPYSCCGYSPKSYLDTFKAVAPKIHAAFPKVLVHATSWKGPSDGFGKALYEDPEALKLIDAWTWHSIGANSDIQITGAAKLYSENTFGKPVFNNEFEYFTNDGKGKFINTAQSIMNWFTFENAPTWYWLHALKPTYNDEAPGYSLGYWRPADDDDFTHSANIQKGCWDYNQRNYNAIAGFLKYMPWDSRRITVDEDLVRKSNRILAFITPKSKLVVVVSNRTTNPFTFQIDARKGGYSGHRYTEMARDENLGKLKGDKLSLTVPPQSVEFWAQD